MIYVGAEHILSPLGSNALKNFTEALNGNTGISPKHNHPEFTDKPISLIQDFTAIDSYSKIESMAIFSVLDSLNQINSNTFNDKWLLILSTTKGDIDHLKNGELEKAKPTYLASRIAEKLPIKPELLVVSNACISGLLGAITAHDYLATKKYDHAIVVGVDVVSKFTSSGFESFFALSNTPSAPFDKDRKGLSLGEAASTVILSSRKEIFTEPPMVFSGGASANDANHISGPSRTGEGLKRSVDLAMKYANVTGTEINFISAHGTGTRYNDDMESIAFNRCGLSSVPLNSFKGYFGHTLGAASVVELSMAIQSMRNGQMLKTLGCQNVGVTDEVNVLIENQKVNVQTVLKTASGFGGCNAAAILKKDIE